MVKGRKWGSKRGETVHDSENRKGPPTGSRSLFHTNMRVLARSQTLTKEEEEEDMGSWFAIC